MGRIDYCCLNLTKQTSCRTIQDEKRRGNAVSIRQLNRRSGLGGYRVILGCGRFGVRSEAEPLREHISDELLRIRRQRRARHEIDDALTIDDRLRPGLIDRRDRSKRRLVEQDV